AAYGSLRKLLWFDVKRALLPALLLSTASAAALPAADPPRSPHGTPAAMPVTADEVSEILARLGAEDRDSESRLARLSVDAKRLHALLLARGRSYVKLARAGLLPVGG